MSSISTLSKLLTLLAVVSSLTMTSCVSKKKYLALEAQQNELRAGLQKKLTDCTTEQDALRQRVADRESELSSQKTQLTANAGQIKSLEDQVDYLKKTNTNLLERMSDLSIVSKSGAESIKRSLDAINEQSRYIKDLTGQVQRKDSLNLALVMNLKRSLADVNDEDVSIEVKKGVVYISPSDKLLFKSGSAVINTSAETVLGKVAMVINDHSGLDILIEGHTDNVPINTDCIRDNWDLSAKRATSVARLLQSKYNVDPNRMIAGGSGEYKPKADNASETGRKVNRRTEIIITPKLDQFFELLTPEQK
ncbi:MAG: OmpA family protein [Saprospiraceae bacterium]|nr:OmpA family protein [Saprospiraceae bacterium]